MPVVPGTQPSTITETSAPETPVAQAPAPVEQAPAPVAVPSVEMPEAPKSWAFGPTSLDDSSQTLSRVKAAGMQDMHPDRAAKILDLAGRAGVAPSLIQDDPEGFEKQINAAGFSPDNFVKKYPKLADWAAENPMHLPLIKDDMRNVRDTNQHVDDYSMMSSAYDALNAGMAQTMGSIARVPGLLYDTAALPQNILAKYTGMNIGTRAADLPMQNKVAQFFEQQGKIFSDRNSDLNQSVMEEISKGNYSRAGRVLFAKTVEGAPQLAQLFVGGAQAHGAKLLGLGLEQAGMTANREENLKADPVSSTVDALGQGAIAMGAGEVGNFGVLKNWGDTLAKSVGRETAGAVIKSFANALTYAFARDASSMAALSVANDITDYSTGINPGALEGMGTRTAESALLGGATGLAIASPGSILSMHGSVHDIRQANLQKDTYLAMGSTMEASKVRERLPQKYREMVAAMTKDGPVENIYVDPAAIETFYQTKGPDELAKAIADLGVEKQFDQAKDAGGLVKVPTSVWAEKIVGTDAHKALADDVTFSPEKPTVNEAKRASEIATENEKRIQEEGGNPEDSGKSAERQIKEKLMKVGQDSATAEKNASLYNFFNVRGQDEGINADELFNRYNTKVGRELPEQLKNKSFDEFDVMLNRIRNEDIPTEQKAYGDSLIPFLKKKGGISHEGQGADVRDLEIKGLSSKKKGIDIDRAAEAAHEAGYIAEPDARLLLKHLADEASGSKTHSPENHTGYAEDREVLSALRDNLQAMGIDVRSTPNEELKKILENNAKQPPADMFDFLQGGGNQPLGGISFGPDGVNITLLKDANLSTFLHETGHFFMKVMGDLANHQNASERTKEINQALLDFVGAESNEKMTVDQHEKVAEAFEKYLLEGKAPSAKLRAAFASFKAWIIHAYKSLVIHPGVKLTPEVRSAFDRMLATDEEIKQARDSAGLNPLIKDVFGVMNEKDAAKYTDLVNTARQAANEKFTVDNLKMFSKERSRMYQQERKMVESEFRKEVSERPEYQILDAIKNGKEVEGGDKIELKIDRKSMVRDFTKEIVDQMPRGIFGKDGMDYAHVADALGIRDGHELAMTLANMHPLEDVVHQMTEQEMAARHAHDDPTLSGSQQEAAMEAVHSHPEAERLAFELKWMMENKLPQYKDLMRKVGKRVLTAQAFREQAQRTTNGMATRDLRPIEYQRAEAKHANEATDHALKGDWDKAFESKYKELLNHEMYKSVVEAKQFVEDGIDKFKRFNRTDDYTVKNRDMDLITAGKVILDKFGIGSMEKGQDAAEYLEKLKAYDDSDQYNSVKMQIDAATSNAGDYRDLPYEQFTALKDTLDSLWDLAKTNKQMEIDGKRMDTRAMKDALIERAAFITKDKTVDYKGAGDPGKIEKWKTGLLSLGSSLVRIEHWVDALDNGDINGPFRKYIWNPISDAAARYNERSEHYEHHVNELSKKYLKDLDTKRIEAPELSDGEFFKNEAALYAAILHTGNESNLKKLLVGRKWGSLDENGNLDRSKWDAFVARMIGEEKITKNHFDYAQEVWDMLEEMKPDAQRAHKLRYGHYFNEVTAQEFETPFGKYKGGYMPAVVDHNLNGDATVRSIKASLETDSDSTLWPQKMDGFTKGRVENYNAPLSLNLSMVNNHIDKVLKFTHLSPAVHDVARVVLDREVSRSLNEINSSAISEILSPWLKRSMNQSVAHRSHFTKLDPVFSYIRQNSGMQTMFLNVKNVVMQLHGLPLAAVRVDPISMARASVDVFGSPKVTAAAISEKSVYMKNKMAEQGIEMTKTLKDIATNPSTFERYTDFMRKNTYFLQTVAQNFVNMTAWKGAYDHAVRNGFGEEEAVRLGDSAVSMTQHNFAPESISSVEHGTPFERLFTMFYSYQNMKANLMGGEFYKEMKFQGLAKGAGKLVYVYAMAAMIPAALMAGLGKGLGGKPWDESGEGHPMQDFIVDVANHQVRDVTAMVPMVGQFANAAIDKWRPGHKSFDDRVSLSPAFKAMESVGAAVYEIPKGLREGSFKKGAINDALTAIGLISGAPVGAASRPLNYLNDVKTGKANPTGPVDYARGLITGQPGK